MRTLKFVLPSSVRGRLARVVTVERDESKVMPGHIFPVMNMGRCVCCPAPVEHGIFCSVLYRYARTAPDGALQYVRAF